MLWSFRALGFRQRQGFCVERSSRHPLYGGSLEGSPSGFRVQGSGSRFGLGLEDLLRMVKVYAIASDAIASERCGIRL